MNELVESHKRLIAELGRIADEERHELRKLQCEGQIYGLYVNLLDNLSSLNYTEITTALNEIDMMERKIMMDNYRYSSNDFYTDYRGEYPCRTSAVIIDIVEKITKVNPDNADCNHVIESILRKRVPLLGGGFYPDYFIKGKELIESF